MGKSINKNRDKRSLSKKADLGNNMRNCIIISLPAAIFVVCLSPLKTVWIQIRTDKMS